MGTGLQGCTFYGKLLDIIGLKLIVIAFPFLGMQILWSWCRIHGDVGGSVVGCMRRREKENKWGPSASRTLGPLPANVRSVGGGWHLRKGWQLQQQTKTTWAPIEFVSERGGVVIRLFIIEKKKEEKKKRHTWGSRLISSPYSLPILVCSGMRP